MNVVNPNNTSHEIVIIPRFYPTTDIVFYLYNETTQSNEEIESSYEIIEGVMGVEFDYQFKEGENFQIKITENENVVYRGKLFATTQDTQDYSITKNIYYY